MRLDPDGIVHAVQPNGTPLPNHERAYGSRTAAAGLTGDDPDIKTHNRARGITIDPLTCVSRNESVDLDHVVTSLTCLDDTSCPWGSSQ